MWGWRRRWPARFAEETLADVGARGGGGAEDLEGDLRGGRDVGGASGASPPRSTVGSTRWWRSPRGRRDVALVAAAVIGFAVAPRGPSPLRVAAPGAAPRARVVPLQVAPQLRVSASGGGVTVSGRFQ